MPKLPEDLQKATLYFRKGDWDKLREIYPGTQTSVVIRRIISNVVDTFEEGKPTVKIEEIHL